MTRPNVGIGIFMFNQTGDKFLIGKRMKEQLYGLPGGTLERGESFQSCAAREIREETAVDLQESRIKFHAVINCVKSEIDYHWVVVLMKVNLHKEEEEQVNNLEADKCEEWIWITFEDLLKLQKEKSVFYPLDQFINEFNIKSINDIKLK